MQDLAFEQVVTGTGRYADAADIEALDGEELARPHLVEEDEGADHLPLLRRQRAAHLEAADIMGARDDDMLEPGRRGGADGIGFVERAHGAGLRDGTPTLPRLAPARPTPAGDDRHHAG